MGAEIIASGIPCGHSTESSDKLEAKLKAQGPLDMDQIEWMQSESKLNSQMVGVEVLLRRPY